MSRSYPAGYVCAVGGYLCDGDSFVHDTGLVDDKQRLSIFIFREQRPQWHVHNEINILYERLCIFRFNGVKSFIIVVIWIDSPQ